MFLRSNQKDVESVLLNHLFQTQVTSAISCNLGPDTMYLCCEHEYVGRCNTLSVSLRSLKMHRKKEYAMKMFKQK